MGLPGDFSVGLAICTKTGENLSENLHWTRIPYLLSLILTCWVLQAGWKPHEFFATSSSLGEVWNPLVEKFLHSHHILTAGIDRTRNCISQALFLCEVRTCVPFPQRAHSFVAHQKLFFTMWPFLQISPLVILLIHKSSCSPVVYSHLSSNLAVYQPLMSLTQWWPPHSPAKFIWVLSSQLGSYFFLSLASICS